MTTLELINRHFIPCHEGEVFAAAHPDPREAIVAALAAPEEDGHDAQPWHFVRYACINILGYGVYAAEDSGSLHNHAKNCGARLLAWLDKEHPVT